MSESYNCCEVQLAKDLHRHYRAISKALAVARHDHGWDGCTNQKYFLRRARVELRRLPRLPQGYKHVKSIQDIADMIGS